MCRAVFGLASLSDEFEVNTRALSFHCSVPRGEPNDVDDAPAPACYI